MGHNCVLKILRVIGRGKGLLAVQHAFVRGLRRLVVVIKLGEDIITDRREATILRVRGEPIVVQVLNILLSGEEDAIHTDRFRGTHSEMVVVTIGRLTLRASFIQQQTAPHFNAYHALLSVEKSDSEGLDSLINRVDEQIRVIKSLSPSSFTLDDLYDELAVMAIIRALP